MKRNAIAPFITLLLFSVTIIIFGCDNSDHGGHDLEFEQFLPSPEALDTANPQVETTGGLLGAETSGGAEVAAFLGRNVAAGIISSTAGQYFGSMLGDLFGLSDPDAEILDKLAEIQEQLTTIAVEVARISTALNDALKEIGLTRVAILTQDQVNNIKFAQDDIDGDFDEYKIATSTNPQDRYSDAQLLKWADQVLSNSKHDIPGKLTSLHSTIVGKTVADDGFLVTVTKELIEQIRAGGDLTAWDYYLLLERYYSELLTVQFKGLAMMFEAQSIKNAADSQLGWVGTAEVYRSTQFVPHIDDQLELFMQCVDQLVMMNGHPNTASFLRSADQDPLPSSAAIYTAADTLLSQISETYTDVEGYTTPYPWGLHAHVFLNPDADHPDVIDYDDAKQEKITRVLTNPEVTGTHTVEQYVQTDFDSMGYEGLRDLSVYDEVNVVTYHKPAPPESVEEYKLILLWQTWGYRQQDMDTIATAAFPTTTHTDSMPNITTDSDTSDYTETHRIGSVAIDGRRYLPSKWYQKEWFFHGHKYDRPGTGIVDGDLEIAPVFPGPLAQAGVKVHASTWDTGNDHFAWFELDDSWSVRLWAGFVYRGEEQVNLRLAYNVDMVVASGGGAPYNDIFRSRRFEDLTRGDPGEVVMTNEDYIHVKGGSPYCNATCPPTNISYGPLSLPITVNHDDHIGFEPGFYLALSSHGELNVNENVTIPWIRWEVDTEH